MAGNNQMKASFNILFSDAKGIGGSLSAGMWVALKKEIDKEGYEDFRKTATLIPPVFDEKRGKHVIEFMFNGTPEEFKEFQRFSLNWRGRGFLGRQVSKVYLWMMDAETVIHSGEPVSA